MAAVLREVVRKVPRCHGSSGSVLAARPCITAAKLPAGDSPARYYSNPPPTDPGVFDPKLYNMKRGTGGRSSFNGVVCTVFGASGFLGRYVCNKLGKIGTQIIIPYRGDHYDVLKLRLVGDLGQVLFFPFHLQDEESIRKAMKYSNVVVNLIGRDWETMNFKFKDVHVTGARTIARIARECGVKRLIHFSSLNCENPQSLGILPDGSQFLKTKYEGELAVRDEFPDATIFRPSDIWGQEDRFLRYYAHYWRRGPLDGVALRYKGERTIKQPVYVSDVAQGVVNAIKDADTAGKTFDIIGPKRYLLSELVDWFFRIMRRDDSGYSRHELRWDLMFQTRVSLTEKFCPSWPVAYLGWDKLERDHVTDTPTGLPTLEELGVALTDMESRMAWELKPYRAHNYYDEQLGEFAAPEPPPVILTKKVKFTPLN